MSNSTTAWSTRSRCLARRRRPPYCKRPTRSRPCATLAIRTKLVNVHTEDVATLINQVSELHNGMHAIAIEKKGLEHTNFKTKATS